MKKSILIKMKNPYKKGTWEHEYFEANRQIDINHEKEFENSKFKKILKENFKI